MGENGNLTMLVIAIGAFILMFGLSSNIYIDLMQNNGGEVESSFYQKYAQIQGYQTNLSNFSSSISDKNLWTSIPSGISSTFNALIIGIGGVSQFFSFVTLVPALFLTIFDGLGIPVLVFSFILFAITLYIVTQFYRAVRNAQAAP